MNVWMIVHKDSEKPFFRCWYDTRNEALGELHLSESDLKKKDTRVSIKRMELKKLGNQRSKAGGEDEKQISKFPCSV